MELIDPHFRIPVHGSFRDEDPVKASLKIGRNASALGRAFTQYLRLYALEIEVLIKTILCRSTKSAQTRSRL
jgi:hypothetical protein